MKLPKEMSTGQMMQEFDKFHPTVKDVEANAERKSGENFRKDPKPKQVLFV
jgi:DNA topoisomerase-1